MALVIADRVKETTTTTGTGTYTLLGAVTGFETFASVGDGNTTYYCCTDGTDFEVGVGTYTASGTTLARTTILQSSNSDAAVNWTAGTRTIFVTLPAEKAPHFDASGDLAFGDNVKAEFGDGADFQIYHNGTNSRIDVNGGNDLQIVQNVNDQDILLYSDDGSGGVAAYFKAEGSTGEAILYHYGSEKLATKSTGVDVTGNITVSGTVDGRDVATDGSKLDGIEASADVTDTANVTAAGALMDSEVTNLAQVKAFNSSDYATAAQGTKADNALPKAGGTMTGTLDFGSITGRAITITADSGLDSADASIYLGNSPSSYGFDITYEGSGSGNTNAFVVTSTNAGTPKEVIRANQDGIARFPNGTVVTGNITVSGTVDGRDVATDGTKLDGIESNATADQTAAEIRTLVESASDSNVFTDADHTKLNGIASSATANPNAIDNVVEDTTPQLGGNLDLNSKNITGTGNINITGTLQTSSNAIIGGDLTVSGTTTTVNTETINLADNNILLNSNLSSSTAPSQNGGITINRGSATDKVFQWNESSDYWETDDDLRVSGGDLEIAETVQGTWTKPLRALVTNLGNNQNAQFTFGKASSTNNLVEFSHHHLSDGNSSNWLSVGYYGATNRFLVRADGKVSVGTAYNSGVFTDAFNVTGNMSITGTVDGRDVAADGTKLDGIATGAEVNQNAFSNVAVSGQTTVAADAETDTLTLAAGSNVTITTNATTDTVTIASTDTTYSTATATTNGLVKLEDNTTQSVAANAVSSTAGRTYGVQLNSSGQMVVNVPWADTNTTYSTATATTNGLVKLEDNTTQSVAANAVSSTAGRTYGVQLNSSGQMVVNVPWVDTDTNTTYTNVSEFTNDAGYLTSVAFTDIAGAAVQTSGESFSDSDTVLMTAAAIEDRYLKTSSVVFPFFKSDGSSDTIPLTADSKLPFFKADTSASNISLTT